MVSAAAGQVSTRVCAVDVNTLFPPLDANVPIIEYPDIMVGTELTIIVDSNVAEDWLGCLIIEDANMDYGVLSARGPLISGDWSGSHLEAAGDHALVNRTADPNKDGFCFYTDWQLHVEAGDWFIIDYNATNIGDCYVGFYEYDPHDGSDILINYLKFTHVRSRDFNKDTKVDFIDLERLTSYWLAVGCAGPDWCEGTDLDEDRDVDAHDLTLFADYWLEYTDKRCWY